MKTDIASKQLVGRHSDTVHAVTNKETNQPLYALLRSFAWVFHFVEERDKLLHRHLAIAVGVELPHKANKHDNKDDANTRFRDEAADTFTDFQRCTFGIRNDNTA